MPRSSRKTAKSPAKAVKKEAAKETAVKEEAPTTRRTRGASAAAIESPSPKKTRKASPSPSPAPRGRSRGRAAAKETPAKSQKGQGDETEEASPTKGRVTRAVVQQEEAPSRGRSSRKASEPKKPLSSPSPTPKSRASSKQKAAATPTKEAKSETSRSRSRNQRAKPEPKTPEPKPSRARSQTKKTPAKKATPSPKVTAKPKASPSPAASRSRSRGKKKENEGAVDMPSAQIILTKIDSPSKSNGKNLDEEKPSPVRSKGRESTKTTPEKPSPKSSNRSRSKSSEKTSPSTRRGRSSDVAKVDTEEKEKELVEKAKESSPKTEEKPTKENLVESKQESEDETLEDEINPEEDEVQKEQKELGDESMMEVEKTEDEEEVEDVKENIKEPVTNVDSKVNIENDQEDEKVECAEEMDKQIMEETEKVSDEAQKEESDAGESVPLVETPPVEESSVAVPVAECSSATPVEEYPAPVAVEESAPVEKTSPVEEDPVTTEAESLSEEVKETTIQVQDEEPMEEDTEETEKISQDSIQEATNEVVGETKTSQKTPEVEDTAQAEMVDGDQRNGSAEDLLSSPSRKRKWDDIEDGEGEQSPKKVRRSVDMADVTCESGVTTNGENQVSSSQEASEESMESCTDQTEPDAVVVTSAAEESQNIEQDYVVIKMDEIPAANSAEVLQSLPKEMSVEEPTSVIAAEQSQQENVVPEINQENTAELCEGPGEDSNPLFSRVYVPNPSFQLPGDVNKQFSVVSYNILAQCHLERNDYSFTESQYLTENYRHQNLMKEIEYLAGDIVCMQEVGPKYYESMLKPAMTKLGYEGAMRKRTQDYFDEGEATFYKTSRFSEVETRTYSLKDLAEQELEDGGVSDEVKASIRKYLDLPDVMVLSKLRCNNTGNLVCVGNIHVQWGKMQIPDAQCIQIVCAIKELAKQGGTNCHAQILCGDFNSEVTSPGYKLAIEGYLSDEVLKQLQALENLEMADSSKAALVNHLWRAFQHTSNLRSAYSSAQGSEPIVTSFNRVMLAAVDYIFYGGSSLENVGVLQTAKAEQIKATDGIPDQTFPSDHVSIKAVFNFS